MVQSTFMLRYTLSTELFRSLPINDQCSPSYRKQSIDLQCRSMDWFLYDGEQRSLMGKIGNYIKENRMIVIKWPCTSLFCIIWKPQSLMVLFLGFLTLKIGFHLPMQKHIKNPVEHLQWNFLRKQLTAKRNKRVRFTYIKIYFG